MLNAFTVDVEDYYQVTAFESDIARESWPHRESRVVANTHRLLDCLARHAVRGTFFFLGWVAERHPDLVRDVHGAGHEIGSHSYWHRRVYDLEPEAFREDLRRSLGVLEDLTGVPVGSYRAPTFSITRRSMWALEILVEEGVTCDSSIFPVRHDRYGVPDAEVGIHEIATPSGPITEFPPTTVRMAGHNLPAGGGGYFRLYPWWVTRWLLASINRRAGRPFMFYVHPWEVDPGQPRLPVGSRLSRIRHRINLERTESRLEMLLREFRLGTMGQVLEAWRAGSAACSSEPAMPQGKAGPPGSVGSGTSSST